MGYINPAQHGLPLSIRGKIGAPNGFGGAIFGLCQFGDDLEESGIYQMRFHNKTQTGWDPDKKTCKIMVKMRHYYPTNPNTPAQQSGRSKFQAGMQAWGALTPAEKAPWYEKETKVQKRANALFMKAYMLDRPLEP